MPLTANARQLGTKQSDSLQNIYGGNFRVVGASDNTGANGAFQSVENTIVTLGTGATKILAATFDASRVARTSVETRAANLALHPCLSL